MKRGGTGHGEVVRRKVSRGADAGRLAELKEAIRTGRYETADKLDSILPELLADLRKMRPPVRVSRADETGGERP